MYKKWDSRAKLLFCLVRASSHEPSWPGWPGYRGTNFRLGFIWEISARFPRWDKAEYPGNEFWRKCEKASKHGETQKSDNFIALAILMAVSLQLNRMVMMWKIQPAMQDDAIRAARVHPGNRAELHIWQNFLASLPRSRLEKQRSRKPSQPALSYEVKGFRGKASPWKTGKRGQPGPCKEALNLLLFLTFSLPSSRGIIKSPSNKTRLKQETNFSYTWHLICSWLVSFVPDFIRRVLR